MSVDPPPIRRRDAVRWLSGMAALGLPTHDMAQAWAQSATSSTTLLDNAHVTVAGPEGGDLDDWSRTLIPALGGFMPPNAALRRTLAGGIDGITGANQFTAQGLPDGSSALLAPGAAVSAWLRGDPRVQYDVARWVPLLACTCSTVLAGRIDPVQLARGQKLRVGISGPDGPELATILGLERLGLQPVPVVGLVDNESTELAFSQYAVDVLILRGPAIAKHLVAGVARPICVLGVPDGKGALSRDPSFPNLPHMGEMLTGMPADALTAAWRATSIAEQLAFDLVLPPLTTATQITVWSKAVTQAAGTPELQAMVTTQSAQLHNNPDAIATLLSEPDAARALRTWLAARSR